MTMDEVPPGAWRTRRVVDATGSSSSSVSSDSSSSSSDSSSSGIIVSINDGSTCGGASTLVKDVTHG